MLGGKFCTILWLRFGVFIRLVNFIENLEFPGRHYSPEIPGREQGCEFSHLSSWGQVRAPVN
jgi:hypothetical protein